jgi:hypothetical protein
MFGRTHKCVVLVCGVLALAGLLDGPSASADDKGKPAPSGAWVRKEGELKIEFDGKGKMKICPHGDSEKIAIVCDYSEKDGRINVKISGVEGSQEKAVEKVKEKLPAGLEFSFKWTVKDDTAKLDDLKGEGDTIDHLKEHLEGDYEQKK